MYDQHVQDWHEGCVAFLSGLNAWDDSKCPHTVYGWCQWAELAEFDDV